MRVGFKLALGVRIAERERAAQAAARAPDVARVEALERALVSVHEATLPVAARVVLPPPEEVDPTSIKAELEDTAGIPDLVGATGGGETPPVASPVEPVDRYELMREHRKRARSGIPFWSLRRRIEAAERADQEAERAAADEVTLREESHRLEQARLDGLWAELAKARSVVVEQTESNVVAERARRAERRTAEQEELDRDWERLQTNDPEITPTVLEETFAANGAPAAPIDCEGDHTTVVMQFVAPEAIIPEKKPARTPTGKRTLKKRTKTETNALYVKALGSNVLATVMEVFAAAPGTALVQMVVVRREATGKSANELGVIYLGAYDRPTFAGASRIGDPARSLGQASHAALELKGRTGEVVPVDLSERQNVAEVLEKLRAT